MATAIQDNPIIVDLSQGYGCFLIGIFLSCILYGVSSLQAFIYFSRYWDMDSTKRKLFVFFIWLVDTVNQALVMSAIWPALIKRYGSIVEVGTIQPGITHHSWIAQIVAFCVQLFFIHRLWVFSNRNWFFAVPMFLMSLFQIVVIIPYNVIIVSEGTSNSQIAQTWATSVVMALRAVTAAEDVILAGGMILLVLKNGMPEYQATRRMVSRLIFLAANTGFWTAAVAIVEISLVAAFPAGIEFLVMEMPLCNIYVNTLLANLNARSYVRGDNFTEYNSTPSRLASSRTGTTSGTGTAGSNLYLGRLGSKTAVSQPDSPMVKIEAMRSSDKTGRYQERSFSSDHVV